jgi:murein L,D-transpeptidase YafK
LRRIAAAIIAGVRIQVLTGLVVLWLCGLGLTQTPARPLHADRVVVLKQERTLELLSHGKIIKAYKVALGGDPVGPKTRQGDHKTPEGVYTLDSRNGHSQFYKSIHISYPNARDRAAARQQGVSPGGDVFVHGLPRGYGYVGSAHRLRDWTAAASRSRTKRSTRFGRPSQTAHRSRFGREDKVATAQRP